MRPVLVALLAPLFVVLVAGPAAARQGGSRGDVDVTYDIGPFDGAAGDWPVAAVEVRGGLTEGDDFTIELTGNGRALFTATTPFRAPVTRIEVDEFVAVGDLTGVTVSQTFEVVTTISIPDPVDAPDPDVPGEIVPDPGPEVGDIEFEPPVPLPTPDVEETAGGPTSPPSRGVVNRPVEILGGGSGRDSGQLAVSVIVSLIVLVLVFRTPLPATNSQRWRA